MPVPHASRLCFEPSSPFLAEEQCAHPFPPGWISLRPGLVRLIPSLSIETTLRMEIAYQPKRTAAVIDDYLFDLYGEQIAWGCIARMLMHRDTPYSNPGMAPAFDARFEQAISRLMNRAGAGHNKPRLQSGGDALS